MGRLITAVMAALMVVAGAGWSTQSRAQEKEPEVILYRLPPLGTRAERVAWLCEELGIPYKTVVSANADLKKINTMGTSPTAKVGGVTIVESGAILQMIEMKLAKGGTTPPLNSPDLAYHLQWLHYAEGSAMTRISTEYLLKSVKGAPEYTPLTQRHMQGSDRVLRYMEEHLSQHPYFGGEKFTSADIMMHFPVKMTVFLTKHDLADYPHVKAWKAKVESRPAFVRAGVLVQSPGSAS